MKYDVKSSEERFWKYVKKTRKCWLWTGSKSGGGYGQFWTNNIMVKAHRFSWELHNGKIPQDMLICHTCDIKNCVNPSHLFLGTGQDNAKDRESKGRGNQPKGEKHYRAKLSETEVKKIRMLHKKSKRTQEQLAAQYGVAQSLISRIVNNELWKR